LPQVADGDLLGYKFSPGQELRYLVRTSFSSRALGDDATALSVEHEAELTQRVLEVFPDGVARISVVIDRLSVAISAPGQESVAYDSAHDEDLSRCPLEMRGIVFLVGKKIEVEQAPSGEILSISGLASIYRQALRELSLKEQQPLERLLREMSHKPRSLLGLGVSFPRHAVQIGEQWSADRGPFPILCGQLIYPCNYTLKEVSDGQPIIEFGGELGETERPTSLRLKPLRTRKVEGVLSFDLEKGTLTRMRGESSSFLHFGGKKELRRRATWELVYQSERGSEADTKI